MWLTALETDTYTEPTLWEELWAYFHDKYFSPSTPQYEHIHFGSGSIVSMEGIIWGIFFGVIIAAALVCYDKNRLGAFVRAITRHQCLWPEKAKTLFELGFDRNGAVKQSLRSRNQLGRIVRCVERDRYDAEVEAARAQYVEEHGSEEGFSMPPYRINFDEDHFYIPDEEHYRAEVRYDNKGSSWRAFLLVVVASIVGAALLFFLLPEMLRLVDNLIGVLSQDDKYLR